MRRVLELALLLGLTLAAAPTWPAKPNAKAQADFKRGAALYRQGDYEKALEAFRASLEKERRPSTILNLAQCHRQLKRAKQALEHYQLYLAEFARQHPGEAIPHEDEVKEHITKLAAEVEPKEPPGPPTQGTLSVRSEPAGAELLLDGKPVGQAPYSGTVGPGRHRVSARLAGHAEASQEVEVVSGQSAEVTVRLAPAAAPAPPAAAVSPAAPERSSAAIPAAAPARSSRPLHARAGIRKNRITGPRFARTPLTRKKRVR